MGAYNSIVECTLDKREVGGANPPKPIKNISKLDKIKNGMLPSSSGRTPPFQGGNIGSSPIGSNFLAVVGA